ncbi:uncharacterized protein BDV14DRAFT_169462 [Aspergillus stella-maris]|uniref:uncharacterized protein n=1 Tax=Aspergillus stella-maris TaxID=1810926 RepID=UPI003CCE37B4
MSSPNLLSPGQGLRHRGLTRAATIAESPLGTPPTATSAAHPQRRNSTLSDSVSEARNTIRSSTDELLFPRANRMRDEDARDDAEESHWHSAPLGLALLPAIAGIFFQNGSAFVTDVTLLALAAVFLNWSVRLPWEWYRSARTIRYQSGLYGLETPLDIDSSISHRKDKQGRNQDENQDEDQGGEEPPSPSSSPSQYHDPDEEPEPTRKDLHHPNRPDTSTAAEELLIHELVALASCFLFPLLGTWILHTIRSNLSRPSEGLVSNYNLTIFLLAAEIRPFSHLLKMVQTRTLHLQRIIANSTDDDDLKDKLDSTTIIDLQKRLEELEAHIAETAADRLDLTSQAIQKENDTNKNKGKEPDPTTDMKTLLANLQNQIQPEIAALNRAMRRYEKRTALTAYSTETRLQVLENKTRDALSLAADAQRGRKRSRGLTGLLIDSFAALFLVPVNIGLQVASAPIVLARKGGRVCRDIIFGRKTVSSSSSSSREKQKQKQRDKEKRSSTSNGDDSYFGIPTGAAGGDRGKSRQTQAQTQTQTRPSRAEPSSAQRRSKRGTNTIIEE